MLTRFCDWASYELNLKQYYRYYAALYTLDGVATSLVLILLWLYVPWTHFYLNVLYKGLLDVTIYIGDAWLGLHPEALVASADLIYETLDTDTLGNTLITLCTSIGFTRAYFGYRIYMRGAREASEKV